MTDQALMALTIAILVTAFLLHLAWHAWRERT